jgi:hypothetical protein
MRRHVLLIVGLVLVATGIKWCFNRAGEQGLYSPPCTSSGRARLAQVYVHSASFSPSIIEFHGKEIQIREAWVERRSKRQHFLVWFPYRKQLDGFALCFSLGDGKEVFQNVSAAPFWVMGDMNESFTRMNSPSGRPVFYQYLDVLPSDITVSLMTSWKEQRRKGIRVEIRPFDQGDRIQQAIPP